MALQAGAPFESENAILPIRLRMLMEETGTTQAVLGEALGVRRQTISLYMNGQSKPDWEQVAKIAGFFNITADYLVGLENCRTHETSNIHEALGLDEYAIRGILDILGDTSFTDMKAQTMIDDNLDIYLEALPLNKDVKIPRHYDIPKIINFIFGSSYFSNIILSGIKAINAAFLHDAAVSLSSKFKRDDVVYNRGAYRLHNKISMNAEFLHWGAEKDLSSTLTNLQEEFIALYGDEIDYFTEKNVSEFKAKKAFAEEVTGQILQSLGAMERQDISEEKALMILRYIHGSSEAETITNDEAYSVRLRREILAGLGVAIPNAQHNKTDE